MKQFFDKFEATDKKTSRSIGFEKGVWEEIDAYRLYGSSKSGNYIQLNILIKEILKDHISRDKEFSKEKQSWVKKLHQNLGKKEA